MHLSASFVDSEDRAEGLEGGADGYLTYPLEPRELLANVRGAAAHPPGRAGGPAQRELLRVTLSSIGDGVIATDADGAVTFINPVAQELTGWGDEALGRPLADVFHIVNEETGVPAENPSKRCCDRRNAPGQPHAAGRPRRHAPARRRLGLAHPGRRGRFVGVVLVFRDVSERRRLEHELQAAEGSPSATGARTSSWRMLAHELRNPLAPIANSLQILQRASTPATPRPNSAAHDRPAGGPPGAAGR